MTELVKTFPVDKVYFVVPHEDGMGFSLREAGVIVPSFAQTVEEVRVQLPAVEIIQPEPEYKYYPAQAFIDDLKKSELKKPKRSKKTKPTSEDDLPNPVSTGGTLQINGFTPATQAEAYAARAKNLDD